jgi:hypothetical protein
VEITSSPPISLLGVYSDSCTCTCTVIINFALLADDQKAANSSENKKVTNIYCNNVIANEKAKRYEMNVTKE